MSLKNDIMRIAKEAKSASLFLGGVSSQLKNKALQLMAEELIRKKEDIIRANRKDVRLAKKEGKTSAFIDRLKLNEDRIRKMSQDLLSIAGLADPVGEMIKIWRRPNGLMVGKMRAPLGVIGIIYESRPDVTSDCAGLCFKAGSAVILRGGRESINSNIEIYKALSSALQRCDFPKGCVNLIQTDDREAVSLLLTLSGFIDLIIPRGGESLIREVADKSKIPVIKHYKGICHTYVDEYADLAMAEEVAFNAKVQRPSTCNAMECLLVHKAVAKQFLPKILERLKKSGVEIRGCSQTAKIYPGIKIATAKDFSTEYLDLILSVKIVNNFEGALKHIAEFGTKHSEAIISNDFQRGMKFLKTIDAACVYINASTRFTDGNEFGLGAEVGISTDKLHARGPMGLEDLTTYKYIVIGNGQTRT
ncbi:MAG: glutamate-5-semialdehyde dehydrogenase [Candidatus Omnitrophica bacterium]|nr:glutamate-5-semialdehyde dehydrogenase [Candidatus Omnitrophota bacterium]